MMPNNPIKPLSGAEFVELGELLAGLPETAGPMEADQMDGYLTAVALMPSAVPPSEWMPFIFDAQGSSETALADAGDEERLEDLVYRRYREIKTAVESGRAIDPIVYDPEDDLGRRCSGWEAVAALSPFASGFLDAVNRWPKLHDEDPEKEALIQSALLGILRHLPEAEIGDLKEIKDDLDLEAPLESLSEAVRDLALSVAEIASVTLQAPLPAEASESEEKPPAPKKSSGSARKMPYRASGQRMPKRTPKRRRCG